MTNICISVRVTLVLMVLCGAAYPLAVTGAAQALFPGQANGSLIERQGVIIGSALLAQAVESPKLFHPRASSAGYNAAASAGSNKAVASEAYAHDIAAQVEALRKLYPGLERIPADWVTGSGSGLDPDLSPEAAKAQALRISRETGLGEQELMELIDSCTQGRQLGLFGEPRVSVLALNLALLERIRL
ncbi:potassium-transporting ATPase subunit KdpC [Paenibacillus athensensis]|uniref:Potassium-transporting ATPase KdpC subunit n=1 Tax=Paenibacillus athensensis TaxID=1967502 RepID=A0A4Y8PZI6_9BACL|nr:potassium-transporting ATPase subunit KdpC [Paenibacillus athensensis]MCD1261243.1 potassium-transporting ATPase subunit KdpC [Paenibacillus athensensis]